MAKIKNTKTELKAQTDALKRYQRFLPMLQLKKQQLQMEIASITSAIDILTDKEVAWRKSLAPWIALFSSSEFPSDIVRRKSVLTDNGNIAGVAIPIYRGIETERADLDLEATPSWLDDAGDAIVKALELGAEKEVLAEQRRLVTEELRTTTQRVNLFEKVKIPECKENIRVIGIHLGDERTAAVARGKIAKRRGAQTATAGECEEAAE